MSFSSGKNLQNNVNTTEAQTLSNKTMDSTTVIESGATITTPAIIDPSRSDVKKDTLSNLQTYASTASNGQLCYATDTKKMFQVLDGALAEVGGGAGGINYITNPDAEVNADGFSNYANTTPGELPDDFGGTVNGGWSGIASTTSNPLRGSRSFTFGGIEISAGDLQGHGVYSSFVVDSADKAKKLTISFDYLIDDSSITTPVDGQLRVYIYDETNSQLIRVNGEDLQLNANSGTHYAQFQTASDSVNYRLVIHNALGMQSGDSFDVKMDNVQVGPTAIAHGTIVTDSINLTASDVTPLINLTGWGGAQLQYRRVGDYLEGSFYLRKDGVAGSGSTELRFTLPDGLEGELNTEDGFTKVGNGDYYNDSNGGFAVNLASTTEMSLWKPSAIASYKYSDVIQTQYISFNFKVKIKGWSSNAKMSEDLGGRDVVVEASGNAGTVISASNTDIDFTEYVDTTGSFNGTQFTAPETGTYLFTGSVRATASTVTDLRLYVDSVYQNFIAYEGIASDMVQFTEIVKLNKGQSASIRSGANITLSNNTQAHRLRIIKLASPQTILETETVAARYTSNSGQSISNNVEQVVIYEDIDHDTHNAYNISTGIYTIPVSGLYWIKGIATYSGLNSDASEVVVGAIWINGSEETGEIFEFSATNGVNAHSAKVSDTILLTKGDEVAIRTYQNTGTSEALTTSASRNVFSIARIK
jgi:hypothetical protein